MNVSTFKGKKCPFSYVRYYGANQMNGAQDIKTAVSIMAAKVSFRQVQSVSPTVQFTLQEFFSSLQFYVRYFLSLSLILAWVSFFSFLPPSPYPFSDILKEKKRLAHARSQTWFSSRCCSRIAPQLSAVLGCNFYISDGHGNTFITVALQMASASDIWIDQSGFTRREKLYRPVTRDVKCM